ncbi:MAG: ABC transporter ATP-binding protein [Actinomycetota bacterium]
MPALLAAEDVSASYGGLRALADVSVAVPERSLAAVLGPNGAGKSTLLRVLAGLHRPRAGRVRFRGNDITGLPAHRVARAGVVLVPEGRSVFPSLSVADNLRLAGAKGERFDEVAAAFPVLAGRLRQTAGTLSGGEQQMLAVARAMAAGADVLLLDEPSLGLAPRLVERVLESVRNLRDEGRTIVLVEQYVSRALEMADVAYVLDKGRVAFAGEPRELEGHRVLERAYLGVAS